MKKKKCIAMLLAGGQGTRLYALTTKVAKPAVSFGAKYRIIDFTLSNCTNSEIDTVGVLTQYEPLILNEYIGSGKPWDLDRSFGGVFTLSPYQAKKGGEWYKGTANAIYQNLHFIEKYDCENVLILSGDHIYKMDYSLMLNEHIKNNADCTIAVFDVAPEEASRFGVMSYKADKRITEFQEKPKVPKSNHASMGVYIFKKDVLVEQLTRDEFDENSQNDFGKNIIPYMLDHGMRLFAYSFSGYWKDVGTVTSLWEANMDLLGKTPAFDLNDEKMKIYSRNEPLPPTYLGDTAFISNSVYTAGCEIYGKVVNSVISEDVYIGKDAVVTNSVIMRGTKIMDGAIVNYGMIDENVVVESGAVIGDENSDKYHIALIGRNQTIAKDRKVPSGEVIDSL